MQCIQFVLLVASTVLLAGCGQGGIAIISPNHKQAMEDRNLTTAHVKDSPLSVRTPNGAIDVVADPTLSEVKVSAHVIAYGDTDDDAKAKLLDIKVNLNRTDDILEIVADIPKNMNGVSGSCSFE